jgi:hypothetical protein
MPEGTIAPFYSHEDLERTDQPGNRLTRSEADIAAGRVYPQNDLDELLRTRLSCQQSSETTVTSEIELPRD